MIPVSERFSAQVSEEIRARTRPNCVQCRHYRIYCIDYQTERLPVAECSLGRYCLRRIDRNIGQTFIEQLHRRALHCSKYDSMEE